MIVLDTNVISEFMSPTADRAVIAWLRRQPLKVLATTAINLFEIRYGLALLPEGRKRQALTENFEVFLERGFRQRILPFDERAAGHCVDIMWERRRQGRAMDRILPDALVASIARSHDASIATRDIGDFDGCGVDLINPWTGSVTTQPKA